MVFWPLLFASSATAAATGGLSARLGTHGNVSLGVDGVEWLRSDEVSLQVSGPIHLSHSNPIPHSNHMPHSNHLPHRNHLPHSNPMPHSNHSIDLVNHPPYARWPPQSTGRRTALSRF